MSWSLGVTNCPRDEVHDRLKEVKDQQAEIQPDGAWSDDAEGQMAAAEEALDALLAVVDAEVVNVTISGHAKGQFENDTDTVSATVHGYWAGGEAG